MNYDILHIIVKEIYRLKHYFLDFGHFYCAVEYCPYTVLQAGKENLRKHLIYPPTGLCPMTSSRAPL